MRADFAQIIDNTKEGMARALGNATFTVQLPEPPAGPQHAPPPRPPHITNTTFPRLDIGPKDDNISKFHQWETKVRFQYQANVFSKKILNFFWELCGANGRGMGFRESNIPMELCDLSA